MSLIYFIERGATLVATDNRVELRLRVNQHMRQRRLRRHDGERWLCGDFLNLPLKDHAQKGILVSGASMSFFGGSYRFKRLVTWLDSTKPYRYSFCTVPLTQTADTIDNINPR